MIIHKTVTFTEEGKKKIYTTEKTAEIIEVRLYAEPSTTTIANDFPLCDEPFSFSIVCNGIPKITFETDDKPLSYRKLHVLTKFSGTLEAILKGNCTLKAEIVIKD